MIYISSSCVTNVSIKESVQEIAENGFKNIELSGGTQYYEGFENDLLELKDKYNLSYRCHNYFPPPKEHFVINLASLDDNIFKKSIEQIKKAIALSKTLGSSIYGFHAGFYININLNEIGKKISQSALFDREKSISRFCVALRNIKNSTEGVDLYIENNVLSKTNFETFNGINTFMLTNFSEYQSLKKKIDFNLLLDVAHLKVSVQTLGLNWEEEFIKFMSTSNYIHISDNDGLHDLNNQLTKSSNMFSMLKMIDTSNKTFTLEVYDEMEVIKRSYGILSEAIQ
jgi:sugar phosphate isomerase/epimerase